MATNAQVDTAASSVPAPFGPLTRVTDMTQLPSPNDDIIIEFNTAVTGLKVFMTYKELTNSDLRADRLNQLGIHSSVQSIKEWIGALNTLVTGMTLPHTYADYKAIINLLIDPRNPLL